IMWGPATAISPLRHIDLRGGFGARFPFDREPGPPLLDLQESRIREPITMSFVRSVLVAVAIFGVVTSGVALAQTTTPSSTSSKIDDVSKWTTQQWDRAKAEWEKEKEKWADCQKQSKDQNLTGRKRWSFLASCMTPSSMSAKIDDVSKW